MSDLIFRENVLKNFEDKFEDMCENCFAYTREEKEVICRRCFIQIVKDIIKESPSAEPERRKEKWIEYPDCLRYEGAYNDDHIVCSKCGHVFSICDNCTEEFDFCPHCGSYNGEQEK